MPDIHALVADNIHLWTSAIETRSAAGRGSNNKLNLRGIQKLRELILELAVRGKLVPQDPNDEPASELLKKIAAEKKELIKEGKIKKQKTLAPICDNEKPFPLPQGWVWARLNDYFDVRDGTHDSPKAQLSGYPLVTSKNLSSGKLDISNVSYISEMDHEKIQDRSKVDVGDILFAMIGSIGNPVIVDIKDEFSIKNVALFKYYNRDFSLPKYLLYFLENASKKMRSEASGGVQSFVSLGALRSFLVAVPPLHEQHRIVAKVDELMALCDRLEKQTEDSIAAHRTLVEALLATLTQSHDADELSQNWARVSEYFDVLFTTEQSIEQLKQTILKLAVMGKLVSQIPEEKPVVKSERNIAEKNLPQNWVWSVLPKALIEGKHSLKRGPFGSTIKKTYFVPSGYKVYEQQHAIKDDFTLGHYYIAEEKFKELSSFEVRPNDIIISCSGTVGKVAIAPPNIERGVINQALLKISLNEDVLKNDYFKILFEAYFMNLDLLTDLKGTAQKNMVPMAILKQEPYPLPPPKEQQRIVHKVNDLMALCDQLKERLSDAQSIQNNLADAIVEKAVA